VTLTMLLLMFAGATIRAFLALYHTRLGYDPDHAMALNLNLPPTAIQTWQQRANQMESLRQAVEHTPGVSAASISVTYLPPFQAFDAPVEILGDPSAQARTASLELIGPQDLQVLRIPLMSGRIFSDEEVARAAHVAVVNQAFATQYFGGRNPIGHSVRSAALKVSFPNLLLADKPDGYFEIVGIAGDARNEGIDHPVMPAVMLPYTFLLPPNLFLIVRTSAATDSVYESIRREMQAVNPELVAHDQHELTWFLWTQAWGKERFVASLFSGFALLALALAAAGLYSVVSYTVAQRTREFGIRMAMGAQRRDVIRLALSSAGLLVVLGTMLGVGCSVALNRVLTHWVQGDSRDPLVMLQVAVVMLFVTILACLLPARRAASVEPARALRQE
jgi:predicted permease